MAQAMNAIQTGQLESGGRGQAGSETLLCSPVSLGRVREHLSDMLFAYLKMGIIIVPAASGLLRK